MKTILTPSDLGALKRLLPQFVKFSKKRDHRRRLALPRHADWTRLSRSSATFSPTRTAFSDPYEASSRCAMDGAVDAQAPAQHSNGALTGAYAHLERFINVQELIDEITSIIIGACAGWALVDARDRSGRF